MTEMPTPPPAVERISAVIGLDATLALIEEYGGNPIYIPTQPIPDSPLVATIGWEAAEKLCAMWGRDYLKVPVARQWRILVYHSRKMSYAEIVRTVRCSQAQVWWTLSKFEKTARQFDLFEQSPP